MSELVKGVSKIQSALTKMLRRYGSRKEKITIAVGYTQSYAIYVHEIPARHKVGDWKFLETPYKELRPHIPTMVKDLLSQGVSLEQALIMVGLQLQRASQKVVPVNTGALKASAFTRKVDE